MLPLNMMLRYLYNPDILLALAVLAVVLILVLVIARSHRGNARMEFLLGLMKDFPKDGEQESEGHLKFSERTTPEHPGLPIPRNMGF